MNKRIIIVGAGISGLAILHYLKKKYVHTQNVDIILLEKNDRVGGTIGSVKEDGCLFETGPNGFLNSKPRTCEFLKEIGLADELIKAQKQADVRYILKGGQLMALPMTPKSFMKSPILSLSSKLRILAEIFIPRGGKSDESVFDFGKRRLGKSFARYFLDPMVSGIYGGDAREINLRAAFPRIAELENGYGSLFKAMFRIKKKGAGSGTGMPKGELTSLKDGMGIVAKELHKKYHESIRLNVHADAVFKDNGHFMIKCAQESIKCDEVYLCLPAYQASKLFDGFHQELTKSLQRIDYAPIAVIGLLFEASAFNTMPDGFGYLIPSSEKNEVMGVLFDSNIFEQRCPEGQILCRAMIGGSRHPEVLKKSQAELTGLAISEINSRYGLKAKPKNVFVKAWSKAIPQYNNSYVNAKSEIKQEIDRLPGLKLVANYLDGISFNDCIENAYRATSDSEKPK